MTAQVNIIKIDELIRTAEIRDKSFKELPVKSADEYLNSIALAALKAHKQRITIMPDNDSGWKEVDELTNILESLK